MVRALFEGRRVSRELAPHSLARRRRRRRRVGSLTGRPLAPVSDQTSVCLVVDSRSNENNRSQRLLARLAALGSRQNILLITPAYHEAVASVSERFEASARFAWPDLVPEHSLCGIKFTEDYAHCTCQSSCRDVTRRAQLHCRK